MKLGKIDNKKEKKWDFANILEYNLILIYYRSKIQIIILIHIIWFIWHY